MLSWDADKHGSLTEKAILLLQDTIHNVTKNGSGLCCQVEFKGYNAMILQPTHIWCASFL